MKAKTINRSNFIRGSVVASSTLRPPWAIAEAQFTDCCTRCYQCGEACHAHLIVKGAGGFPIVSFKRHGCDYCGECVEACPEKALDKSTQNPPWLHQAKINSSCLAKQGVICSSCVDVCDEFAIKVQLKPGGISAVQLEHALCHGCGECVHVCPTQSIEIINKQNKTTSQTYNIGGGL